MTLLGVIAAVVERVAELDELGGQDDRPAQRRGELGERLLLELREGAGQLGLRRWILGEVRQRSVKVALERLEPSSPRRRSQRW